MRYPVGTRKDPYLRTRLVAQLAGWLAAWKRQKIKYHATTFLTYTQAQAPLQPPNGSLSNYIPDKNIFSFFNFTLSDS